MKKTGEKNIFILFVLSGIVALWYMFNQDFQIGGSYMITIIFAYMIMLYARNNHG